ncbi:MAG: ABC transporter substrate-binding protein, partial [Gammaproteobacteria bacterium]
MSNKTKVGGALGEIGYEDLSVHDQSMLRRALHRGTTRREMMAWLITSGVTIAAAGSIVTGARIALAATPKKGGNVRFAWDLHGPSDTLDPAAFTSSIDYGRGRLTYNNLTRLQPDLTVKPELAESFEPTDDVKQWVFKLRKGVVWHDGSKFTADDVIYSMMRHIGKDSVSKAKVLVGGVEEWVKD